jgi:hypothetical protein
MLKNNRGRNFAHLSNLTDEIDGLADLAASATTVLRQLELACPTGATAGLSSNAALRTHLAV